MGLYQIVYRSTATNKMADDELERLVTQARIRNYSLGITGVLFYADRQFVQLLEGEQHIVEQMYDTICQDARHHSLVLMLAEPTPVLLFPNWSMGFSCVPVDALLRLANYLSPSNRTMLPRSYNAREIITDLLREFAEEQAQAAADEHRRASWR